MSTKELIWLGKLKKVPYSLRPQLTGRICSRISPSGPIFGQNHQTIVESNKQTVSNLENEGGGITCQVQGPSTPGLSLTLGLSSYELKLEDRHNQNFQVIPSLRKWDNTLLFLIMYTVTCSFTMVSKRNWSQNHHTWIPRNWTTRITMAARKFILH